VSLGAARDDLGDPQGGPGVEASRGGRAAQDRREIREVAEADRAQAARAEEGFEAGVLARVATRLLMGRSRSQSSTMRSSGGVGVREGRLRDHGMRAEARAQAAPAW
jgi:hypothetical protein